MFTKLASVTSMLLAASAIVNAVVIPSEPGPGAVYTAGETCSVVWAGDADSDTTWKDMAIQLMTGDNWDMIHLTTIATGLDGTISGRIDFDCPEVTPNSAVYFYQFTSPNTDEKTWATRFTIAGADGSVVPPEFELEADGATVLWGIGALADPSTANPPPVPGAPPVLAVNNGAAPGADNGTDIQLAEAGDEDAEEEEDAAAAANATDKAAPANATSAAATEDKEGAAVAPAAGLKLVAAAVLSAVSVALFV